MRLLLLLAYLVGVYVTASAFCAIDASAAERGGNWLAGLIYCPAVSMIRFWLAALILFALSPASSAIKRMSVFVIAGLASIVMSGWMFNPNCRYSAIWESRCLRSVGESILQEQDASVMIVVAHVVGCLVWLIVHRRYNATAEKLALKKQ